MNTASTSASARGPGTGLPVGRDRVHLLLAALLMLACLALSVGMKPSKFWADKVGEPDLEHIVPTAFGDWTLSPYGTNAIVNPQQEEALRDLYSKTVARVYIHKPTGRKVMLSLAYGRDQSRDTQLHAPEACYGSQGFRINRLQSEDISVGNLTLPAVRMDAVIGMRQEYVTYWVRVGDELARGSLQRNLVRIRFATRGYIADGLLFRVSEVTQAPAADSYALQDEFLRAVLARVPKAALHGLVGHPT